MNSPQGVSQVDPQWSQTTPEETPPTKPNKNSPSPKEKYPLKSEPGLERWGMPREATGGTIPKPVKQNEAKHNQAQPGYSEENDP